MKRSLFGKPMVIMVVMLSIFCSCGNKGNINQTQTASDSVAVESTEIDPTAAIVFLENMYKDFFDNKDFNTQDNGNLRKYLSDNIIEKILMECPYDDSEGEKSYIVECFADGSLSYERPDYGDRVVKREIRKIDDDWFEVINRWDATDEPVRVLLKVSEDGNNSFKVTGFKMPKE